MTQNFIQLGSLSCMDKIKACFLKSMEISKYMFGENDERVADCHYNLGIAFKKVFLFNSAEKHLEDALKIY